MKHKIYILTILFFYCSLTLFAEEKLAMINDADGFTNIRSGKGKEFSIIATIDKDEFFYCEMTEKDEWIKIIALKWIKGKMVEGYIHRSRIQLVENFSRNKQKELISQILNRRKIIAETFHNNRNTKNRNYEITDEEISHRETKYNPILGFLPKYFCATNDISIIQLFFETMWAEYGSANEIPSFAIGECFVCKPNIIIEQLVKINDTEQKELILNHIEWGLLNYFYPDVDETGISDNKEFNRLFKMLTK